VASNEAVAVLNLQIAPLVQVQASSPSAEVKAAAAQVGDRNWNWEKNSMSEYAGILYPGQSVYTEIIYSCSFVVRKSIFNNQRLKD